MKRLYLTVEGQTEQAFAVNVLQPYLASFNIFVTKPRLTGLHKRRKGRIPTGGLLTTFEHSLDDIRKWMREDQSTDARFSIMVDLYSLPNDFPGYDEAMEMPDPFQKANKLEEALANELNDSRFIPYVQVHEFEAIILTKPDCFLEWFEGREKQVDSLKAECEQFKTPEEIDQGQQTHPKARIKKYIPDYQEKVDGPVLAKFIGLDEIKKKCPHFAQWLSILEKLDLPQAPSAK